MTDLKASTPIERDIVQVNGAGAFELLVADCLRMESFPREIQVTGRAMGWTDRIHYMAMRRGWKITITIAEDDELERAAADLWRQENPDTSVFDCDYLTKVEYRRRAAHARLLAQRPGKESPDVAAT